MNRGYKVSILIPMYNAQEYLAGCLNSIMAQDYDNLEVIIVDDGSTDGSYSVAKEYVSHKVHLFTQQNIGISLTRKRCVELSEGAFVFFVDADDYIEPDAVSSLVDTQIASRADIVYGDSYSIIDKNKKCDNMDDYICALSTNNHTRRLWGILYRRMLFDGIDFFTPGFNMGEDLLINIQLHLIKNPSTAYLQKHIYNYVRRQNSAISRGVDLAFIKHSFSLLEGIYSKVSIDQHIKRRYILLYKLDMMLTYINCVSNKWIGDQVVVRDIYPDIFCDKKIIIKYFSWPGYITFVLYRSPYLRYLGVLITIMRKNIRSIKKKIIKFKV